MKLYLSSYRIPTPDEFQALLGKPLRGTTLALIPNAKDYYAERAWQYKVGDFVAYLESLGIKVTIVDLRKFNSANELRPALENHDAIWAMGGNTFCLRYEMRRSGFEAVIQELLETGIVYGGDSAGALVAGEAIGGIGVELADEPEFAEEVINEGLSLVPYIVIPHIDNPEFTTVLEVARKAPNKGNHIELKDSQAVIFDDTGHRVVEGRVVPLT